MVNDVVMLNAKEMPLGGKPKSVHLVFSFVNDSLFWWSMATIASRKFLAFVMSFWERLVKCRPCEPWHRASAVSPCV